jgi:hypothetical protein
MRTFKSLMISLCMGTTLCMCLPQTTTAQTVSSGDSWKWDKGTIVIDTPERPSGQKSVLGSPFPLFSGRRASPDACYNWKDI